MRILPAQKGMLALTLVLGFIYETILSLQGFDLCDEGSALTVYQQIFTCPSSVEYQFLYYLGGIIGGVWNILFGFGGILSFRIFTVIVLVPTIYFTWLTVKDYIAPVVIPIAVFLVLLMSNFGIMVFFHDYLTALLVAVSAYYILKGLHAGSYLSLFWGALFCGVNIFTRIPNMSMLALAILLFIDFYYERNSQRFWKSILYSAAGLLAGISLVLLLMLILGHLDIFAQSVSGNLFSKGSHADSPHNFSKLLTVYAHNYMYIVLYMLVFVGSVFLFSRVYKRFNSKWIRAAAIICFSGVAITISLFAFNNEKYYALILFPLLASCYIDRKNKSIILLNVASLIIMVCLPLGSDVGVLNMGYFCVWLASFMSVHHIYRLIQYEVRRKNYAYLVLFSVFYFLYVTYGLYVVSRNAYYDRGSRLEKRFKAKNDKFTVFTAEEKVKEMDILLSELGKYVKKGDYLFCFESLPMIHYLTETKPYMGNPWTWVYDPEAFRKHLDKSVAEIPLPVVVRQKCQPIGGYWTTNFTHHRTDIDKKAYDYFYKTGSIDYFEKFLEDNRYLITWENDLFVIYTLP
ncbi:MAG: glycosyltransferase family 39 protein [Candidatus Symbiothrix sp.]|nr:glycosyltransferase family 39 protein [Candidatus Symbiothrix sp.]